MKKENNALDTTKKEKITLDLTELKIESFVTLLSDAEKEAIRGGSGVSWSNTCQNITCTPIPGGNKTTAGPSPCVN